MSWAICCCWECFSAVSESLNWSSLPKKEKIIRYTCHLCWIQLQEKRGSTAGICESASHISSPSSTNRSPKSSPPPWGTLLMAWHGKLKYRLLSLPRPSSSAAFWGTPAVSLFAFSAFPVLMLQQGLLVLLLYILYRFQLWLNILFS